MNHHSLVELRAKGAPASIGHKGDKLQFLLRHGYRVPRTYVCPYEAFVRFQAGDPTILTELRADVARVVDPTRWYAVRSSASVEDRLDYSFAGQFKSRLDVQGVDAIVAAVEETWLSTQSAEVGSYLARQGIERGDFDMAVIIQEMVSPWLSGVAFSKHPTTGLNEVLVEAVYGRGEALVQDGITPMRWRFKWGSWLEAPPDADPLTDTITKVVEETRRIARVYKGPVDLEWVSDGENVHWVQLRPITALAGLRIYSNRIAREVLPGVIKPLVWSINVPLVNRAWLRLFSELVGSTEIAPEDLAKAFHYHAYFDMSTIGRIFEELGLPRESLELLLGLEAGEDKPRFLPTVRTARHVPRLLRLIADKWRFERKVKPFIPRMRATFAQFAAADLSQLKDSALLDEVDRLSAFTRECAYYNIVVPLLQSIYAVVLKRQLARSGVDFEAVDLTRGLAELEAFNPNRHLSDLHDLLAAMDPDCRQRIQETGIDLANPNTRAGEFQAALATFLQTFGHLSDSGNDFSSIPWRETPGLVVQMAIDYRPKASGPGMRGWEELPLGAFRRRWLSIWYHRARRFRFYREAISFHYTFGYGLFRRQFVELGKRLAARGVLEIADDIFYLYADEVRAAVGSAAGEITGGLQERIVQRKDEIDQSRHTILPDIIYGEQPPPLDFISGQPKRFLQGIPTSHGYFEGPACVITSIHDIGKMRDGSALVVPYTDVSWTPLFARAGAVVAESGGLLSHSSIVAREYGIPAVVSVTGACSLLDGAHLSVDGHTGKIFIHES